MESMRWSPWCDPSKGSSRGRRAVIKRALGLRRRLTKRGIAMPSTATALPTYPAEIDALLSGKTHIPLRAPRGTTLHCQGWIQEAALRMLLNNLDPEVAEHPDELIVYGGAGKAARNWEALRAIVR